MVIQHTPTTNDIETSTGLASIIEASGQSPRNVCKEWLCIVIETEEKIADVTPDAVEDRRATMLHDLRDLEKKDLVRSLK